MVFNIKDIEKEVVWCHNNGFFPHEITQKFGISLHTLHKILKQNKHKLKANRFFNWREL